MSEANGGGPHERTVGRLVALLIAAMLLQGCNEYEQRGELYQCFKDGDRVYASNYRPLPRGGNWHADRNTGEKFEADECYCMGCAGF